MRRWAFLAVAIAAAGVGGAAMDERVSFVPWRVQEAGSAISEGGLTLFWIPATSDELKRSPLLTSPELLESAARCVAMRIVRLDDLPLLEALQVNHYPAVVLVDAEGKVAASRVAEKGTLAAGEVERLVRDELGRRTAETDRLLDTARAAGAGRRRGGVRAVWAGAGGPLRPSAAGARCDSRAEEAAQMKSPGAGRGFSNQAVCSIRTARFHCRRECFT